MTTTWRFPLVPDPGAGRKATGTVAWGDEGLAGWEWPYIAVHGASEGPAVLITAGVHAAEYPAIDCAIRVAASLDPATVRGQVLVLPVIDPPMYWTRTAFVCPLDGKNPNRVFPGSPDGTFTERLAHHLTERAIRHADAYIDLHGGDVTEDLEPFSLFQETGNAALDERSRGLALAIGLPHLLPNKWDPNNPVRGTTTTSAATHGVAAVLAEVGGCGLNKPEDVITFAGGVTNGLRYLGVLPEPARPMPEPTTYSAFVWPRTTGKGFFRADVRRGDEVRAGQPLGALVNFFNEPVETITAPVAGRILFITVSPAMAEDALVAGIGQRA